MAQRPGFGLDGTAQRSPLRIWRRRFFDRVSRVPEKDGLEGLALVPSRAAPEERRGHGDIPSPESSCSNDAISHENGEWEFRELAPGLFLRGSFLPHQGIDIDPLRGQDIRS